MVSMPWAIATSSPTCLAISSSQWMGFRSPDTPGEFTRAPRVSAMTFSGRVSPTFTESNSRNAIFEATFFSLCSRATGQGRIRLLDHFAGFVGHDVLCDDDVGAERLPDRVDVHIAVQLVAGLDRLEELQLLVDLDDLGV